MDIKNILFITTDQQRRDSLPCYGLDFVRAPNLEGLARRGVVFDNCVSVAPVCQPARAAFITGQYPSVLGITDNFQWIRPGTPVVAERFREAGFQTAAIGKMHFHPWDNPEGFEYRIIAEDKRHIFRPDHYTRFLEEQGYTRDHPALVPGYADDLGAIVSPLPEDLHIDSFIGREAVKWIDTLDRDAPFFGWVSFNSPHDPYDPPAALADLYRNAPVPPAAGSAEELAGKPAYQETIIPFFRDNLLYLTDYSRMTEASIRRMREYYYATITLVDRRIGEILARLEERGLADSTLVVFSSDHGDTLGDHGLPFKSTFYEGALKVPLIAAGPGIPAGRRCSSFADWLDLHRTFLLLAGLEPGDHVQGTDLRRLFADPALPGRREAYSELPGCAMVINEKHKLVLCDDGDGELYDLSETPCETVNHFHDPAWAETRRGLTEKIALRLTANGRVRRFGGGRHADDEGRRTAFADIKRRVENNEYPGLHHTSSQEAASR
jgi:arylsulfatase A-like enzyme